MGASPGVGKGRQKQSMFEMRRKRQFALRGSISVAIAETEDQLFHQVRY